MRTSELRGKTVISVPGGENIGTVTDVLFQLPEQRVGAIVVKADRFAAMQIVLAEDIGHIDGDVVAIASADNLKDQTRDGDASWMLSASAATGRQVATASGDYVGKLAEIHLDPLNGKISSFDVSGGVFARLFGSTHNIVATNGHAHLGRDLLIVADEVVKTPAQP